MNWWKSPKSFPLHIFLIALILRLMPVILMRNMGIGLDDLFQYDMLARSISAGNGYRWYAQADLPTVLPYLHLDLNSMEYDPRGVLTSFRPPLYPAFLALVYSIAGVGARRFFITRLVQAILAASLAPLTYELARSIFPNDPTVPSLRVQPGAAKMAGWVVALYPMLVIYPLSLATENLFFVLVLSSTLVLLKAKKALVAEKSCFWKKYGWFALAGVLLGMTCLTRTVAEIYAVLAVIWIWFFLKKRIIAVVVMTVIGIVILPWIARNSLLYGQITGIETALGYDLYIGYHPAGTGTFQYPQSLDLMTMVNDSQRDKVGMEKAWVFIRTDPARVPYLVVRRAGYFFGLERRAITYFYSNNFFGYIPKVWLALIAAIVCLPFVLVSISGVLSIAFIKWRAETWLMALFFFGYITPHLFIIAEDRFHLTIVPFLAILATVFWSSGWYALKTRWQTRTGKIVILLATILIVLLFANWGLELWRDADKLTLLLGTNGNQTYFPY